MDNSPKAHWHKIAAAVLMLTVLIGASGFSLWFTYDSVLGTLAAYDPLKSWRSPSSLREEMENAIRYQLPYRLEIRDIYSIGLVAQGKRETGNFFIVKDNDGYLQRTNLYQEIDPNIAEYARRLGKLRQAAELKGTQVLFVGTTGKFVPGTTKMPEGYLPDHASLLNLDELFLELLAYRVSNLDLRESFKTAPLSYTDYYYRTDSRWTARAAQFAAGSVADGAKDKLGIELDSDGFYRDLANYEVHIYPQILLGDYGHSAGIPFSGLDDFVAVIPAFATDLTLEISSQNILRRGPFSESVLNMDYLNVEDPRYDNPSKTYFGGGVTQVRIVNHHNPGGEKVLLLCDSTFLTTAAYLALMCGEVDAQVVAPNDVASMEKLVASGEYSLVVVACEAQSIGADMFPFFKK